MKIGEILKSLSVRARMFIIFISLIATTLTVLGIIIFSSWINSAKEISLESSKNTNDDTVNQVEEFLINPVELNQLHENLIRNSYVNMLDEVERERFFILSLKSYDNQVYSFSYGTVNGEYYGARRNEDNVIEIMRNNQDTGGYSWYYSVNEDFTANERVLVAGLFDPRIRPWYTAAENSGSTVFSPIYPHFVMEDLTISLATPIYNDLGELQGVLGTHMVLSNINIFLSKTLASSKGIGVIIDMNSNELIANSMGLDNYEILEDDSIHRFTINEVSDSFLSGAYQYYMENNTKNFELKIDGESRYYSISEIHAEGIDWIIITSIPRGTLFVSIINNILLMIGIFVFSIIIMMVIYYMVIINVFKPIDELISITSNYSKGDFSKRANTKGTDEFSKLATAFNSMALDINELVNGLEQTVLDRTENLRIVNQNLKEAHQIAKLGRWELNHNRHQLVWSETIFDIFEIDSEQFEGSYESFLRVIHPDDRITVDEAFNKSLVNKQGYSIEHRLLMDDGRIKWVSEQCNTEFDEKGQPIRSIGVVQDITENRVAHAEAVYRKELLQYIIGHSSQGIAVHDKDLNYVYVSDKYCDMYHVSKDLIGKHHYDVFPDLPQKWRDVHQRTLKGEILKGDKDVFNRSDGSVQYTNWLSQPWYDVQGEIAGIIIYTELINELVDVEMQLEKTVDQLQLVMESLPIGIAVTSVDPIVEFEYMNSNFVKIYGISNEDLKKTDFFWDAVYEDDQFRKEIKDRVLSDIASNNSKKMIWEDIPLTKHGKPTRYISAYATPIPNSKLLISTVIDVTDRKQKEIDIVHTSNHDFLTGLHNRKYFEERLIELDQKEYYPLLIAMIDFDGLKLINDAYGHDIGDESLKNVSKILMKSVRESDFVARIGGDEFIILCPQTTLNDFEKIKDSILSNINFINVEDMKFSLSMGYDVKYDLATDMSNVLKNAENNMYSNKILHGQSTRNETIMTLFETLNEKYDEERLHSDRVSQYCKHMGETLKLTKDQIKELEFAGLMHDIGKITIPDSILDKPGKLTDEEWVIMKKHTINGYHILRSADKYSRLAEYALTHHERWDGKGYPNGLKGEEIPLFSRIISITDAYEAMTADRPYRKALDKKIAIEELNRCAGSQFDKSLVEVFVNEIIQEELNI